MKKTVGTFFFFFCPIRDYVLNLQLNSLCAFTSICQNYQHNWLKLIAALGGGREDGPHGQVIHYKYKPLYSFTQIFFNKKMEMCYTILTRL